MAGLLPIASPCVVSKADLEELAGVLCQHLEAATVPEFADFQLEMFKELRAYCQGLHQDCPYYSQQLARSLCCLSVLRAHLRDQQPRTHVSFDEFSRYNHKIHKTAMQWKLQDVPRAQLLRKYAEVKAHKKYFGKIYAALQCSDAWMLNLQTAHCLVLDLGPHLHQACAVENDSSSEC